jgi:hypothetical protein
VNVLKLSAKQANRRIRRMTPGVDVLEGRQLLATIATTLDANNNPIIFTIGENGIVQDEREVPTNNSASPYRSNGLETLSGLNATSIAAYQLPNGDPVVLATTGPESYIYEKEYEATGDPAQPYVWTSWEPISQFVAQSVIAVSATNGNGPAIFAIGADNNVYENIYSSVIMPGPFTDFQILPGLTATSLAATYDSGDTFRVFALTGSESYVYQDTTTLSDSDGTIDSAGWTTVDPNFVASSISVTTGPTAAVSGASSPNTLMVFATGAGDGNLYDDTLTLDTDTGDRTGAGFGKISLQPYQPNGIPEPTPTTPFIASSAVDSGGYLTVFAATSNGNIYENQYVLTGLVSPSSYWVGWQLTGLQGASVVSTVAYGGGVEALSAFSVIPAFITAPAHAALSFPGYTPIANVLSQPADLSTTVSSPLATTTGVTGYPVVFTIGYSGTVYESQDEATGSGVTTTQDPYSAFTAIPGTLSATSIAVTTEPDGIALFALTSASSIVFENQYRPTGTGSFAWTGWQTLGPFVATSIAAATGGDSASNGPTFFAIGINGNVYDNGSTAPTTPSDPYTFGGFTQLTGLAASTISARATSTGIVVAALTGPESYADADIDTAGTWGGWQQTGNYVMSTVLAATSATGGPAVAGTSPLGYQAVSDYGTTSWGAYQPLAFDPYIARASNLGVAQIIGLASVTLPDQVGVNYYDLVQSTTGEYTGVYAAYSYADGTGEVGPSPISNFAANSIAAAPDTLQPTYYIVGQDGNIYVNQAVPLEVPGGGFGDSPRYGYLGYVPLGTVPA